MRLKPRRKFWFGCVLSVLCLLSPVSLAPAIEIAVNRATLSTHTGIDVCEELKETRHRFNDCVRSVAINLNDHEQCGHALSDGAKYSCIKDVGLMNEDLEICRTIPYGERARDDCIGRVAFARADPSLCEELADSHLCFKDIAVEHGMPELCERLRSRGGISYRDLCYRDAADRQQEWEYCEPIRVKRILKECIAQTPLEADFSHPVARVIIPEAILLMICFAVYGVRVRGLPRVQRFTYGASLLLGTLSLCDFLLWPNPFFVISAMIMGPFYLLYLLCSFLLSTISVALVYGLLPPVSMAAGLLAGWIVSLRDSPRTRAALCAFFLLFCLVNLAFANFAANYNP